MAKVKRAEVRAVEDVTAEMQRRAREAVEMAATVYNEALDGTEPTVEAVERILDSLGADRKLSDDDRARVAWAFGPYLGEVVRRRFPDARWERFHPTFEHAGPYIQLGDIQVFPVLWCHKRLHNGPPDSVIQKYHAFREAHLARAGAHEPVVARDHDGIGRKRGSTSTRRRGR